MQLNVKTSEMTGRSVFRLRSQAGFSVAEMLVYLIVSVFLMGAIYELLAGQNRHYSKQRELQDVRGSLRAAAELLSVEIRSLSPAGGDIYAMGADSIVVRSFIAGGEVCAKHATQPQLGVYALSGEFAATTNDSVLIYVVNGTGPSDDVWRVARVTAAYGAGGGSVPTCAWGGATEAVVQVDSAGGKLSGVQVGGSLRAFRRITYKPMQQDGRWWLGRRVGAGSYERLIGPLRPPSDSGLKFQYYTWNGTVTATPASVRLVEILLRGESLNTAPQAGAPAVEVDSVRTRVVVRG
jgi:hypothetical protein